MATEDNWRDIMRTNRSSVLMSIELDAGLWEELKSRDVFTRCQLDCIWPPGKKMTSERAEALLGMLEKKYFLHFQKFCEALEKTGQGRLVRDYLSSVREWDVQLPASVNQTISADALESSSSSVDTFSLPKPFSLSNSAPFQQEAPLNFEHFSVNNEELRLKINEEVRIGRAYRCDRNPRGRAVIINNEFFIEANMSTRYGSEKDVHLLKDLFKFLLFEPKVHENLTDENMLKILRDESKDDGNSQCDMFVLFIMSHGLHGGIYGINGRSVKTEEIMELFDGKNCPSLCNKPKLIFIQACQGDLKTFGVAPAASVYQYDKVQSDAVHEKADMALICSTVKDHVAWRNTAEGSYFVRYINEVFRSKAGEEDLMSMITEVFKRLHSQAIGDDRYKQIGEKCDTLRRKVYLLP